MTRPTLAARVVSVAVALLVALPTTALAQQMQPEPVLDRAPARIGYRDNATLRGHVENGTPGQTIRLQRRPGGADWRTVARKPSDDSNRVRFVMRDQRRTASYRLVYRDEVTGDRTVGNVKMVKVAPRLTLRPARHHVMVDRRVWLRGNLYPKKAGREVIVQQRIDGTWRTIARPSVIDGFFSTKFRPGHVGLRALRVRFPGDGTNAAAAERDSIRIYDPDLATWYGPGLYGNSTACGKTLGRDTLGVAHRSLPCGTKVSLLYQGRTITVPVIDRGPYSDAEWDLTAETAERLRFEGTDTVGTDPR